jgi:hypothetical protein
MRLSLAQTMPVRGSFQLGLVHLPIPSMQGLQRAFEGQATADDVIFEAVAVAEEVMSE